jgi:aspartyl-tRNA(Asn)/glutamyl-tRNA(Gln) amidotransferase subunit C
MKMDIEKVARLARLELSEEEKETFGNQLEQILTYMEQLNQLDTTGVEPTSHAIPIQNVFREDETQSSFPGEKCWALPLRKRMDQITLAFDKAGNFNATETRNVSIDAIKPAVSFASNTETSGTSVSRNNIVINATATDANLRNITIYLYNSTARINLTKQLRKPVIFQLHWPG